MVPDDRRTPGVVSTVFGNSHGLVTGSQYGGKPIMVGETASCNNYVTFNLTPDQVGYISDMQTQFDNATFPQIRALMYFDSGNSNYKFTPPNKSPQQCVWNFGTAPISPDPISGLTAFSQLANDQLFALTVLEQ